MRVSMRIAHASAILGSLSCALLAASCFQGTTATERDATSERASTVADDDDDPDVGFGGGGESALPVIYTCRDDCDRQAEAAWARCRSLPQEKRRRCWEEANLAYAECLKKCKD
jgi:hypothetical protein